MPSESSATPATTAESPTFKPSSVLKAGAVREVSGLSSRNTATPLSASPIINSATEPTELS